MQLLQKFEDRGYPSDYLLSRIRGKRAGLISDWAPLIFSEAMLEYLASSPYKGFVTRRSPEDVWTDLMKEYQWVYLRMDREFLEIFRPFFLCCELRTIFICLRHIKAGKAVKTGGLLLSSLLSEEMKKVLRETPDLPGAARILESAFLRLSGEFAGLADICEQEGLKGFERELTRRFLVTSVRTKLHPLMKEFFVRIIDSRNIISLYKFLRLAPETAPAFIPHGRISESKFSGIIERKEISEVFSLTGTKDKGPGRPDIEKALYRNITVFLRKAGRDPLGIGPVLDYLWRSSLEAMNLNILSCGRDIDRDVIRMELVS